MPSTDPTDTNAQAASPNPPMPADPVVAQAFEAWNDGDKSKGYDDRKRGFEAGYAAHRTPAPAGDVREAWRPIDDAARDGKYQWVGRGGDYPFADWLRWDGERWMFSDGSHILDDGRYGALVYHALPAAPTTSPTPDSSAVSGSAEVLREAAKAEHARIVAKAKEALRLTQGCLECNAEDERRWSDTIRWLEEQA